eukprot:COSAG01_NODE_40611_length_461_cov_2.102210_2_plen_74_part_01
MRPLLNGGEIQMRLASHAPAAPPFVSAAALLLGCAQATAAAGAVPTISELGADWVEAQPLRDTPTVSNFWGAVG